MKSLRESGGVASADLRALEELLGSLPAVRKQVSGAEERDILEGKTTLVLNVPWRSLARRLLCSSRCWALRRGTSWRVRDDVGCEM